MLSLSEKLMLLALHDEKGSVLSSASTALPYGLAGSLLIELLFREKITIAKKKITVLDHSPTGDDLLDRALNLIYDSEKQRSAKYWVQKINSKIKGLKELVTESLISKGILKKEEYKILWVFPAKRHPMMDASAENEIRTRIHQVVIQQDRPNQEDIALLSLVNACDLFKEVLPKEDRKRAKRRTKEIIEEEQIGQAVSSVVTEITVAVSAAVGAAVAASAASR